MDLGQLRTLHGAASRLCLLGRDVRTPGPKRPEHLGCTQSPWHLSQFQGDTLSVIPLGVRSWRGIGLCSRGAYFCLALMCFREALALVDPSPLQALAAVPPMPLQCCPMKKGCSGCHLELRMRPG